MVSIKSTYPLHYFVWKNDSSSLEDALLAKSCNKEQIDIRKRTALMLAIHLCRVDCVRVLLRYGVDPTSVSSNQWSPIQEAISTGNKELVKLVQSAKTSWVVKEVALKIKRILTYKQSDFYFEINWEYTSWLPILNSINLNDSCRIWRKGSNLRVDFNQIGFNDTIPMIKRKLSYIFSVEDDFININEIDITLNTCYQHRIDVKKLENTDEDFCGFGFQKIDDDLITDMINQPIFTSFLDTELIELKKTKNGILSNQEITKEMEGLKATSYTSKNDLKMTLMRRTDHLQDDWIEECLRTKGNEKSLTSGKQNKQAVMLNLEEAKKPYENTAEIDFNPRSIRLEEYFDETSPLAYDIGRTKKLITKFRNFKSTVWTTDSISEGVTNQVESFLEIASYFNPFIDRLCSTLRKISLPGFPLELNIPLYYVLFGKVNFSNLYAATKPTDYVKNKGPGECEVSDEAFRLPNCRIISENEKISHFGNTDEQDQIIKFAAHKSLVEYGNSSLLVQREFSLQNHKVITRPSKESFVDKETAMMQEAIHESLSLAERARIPPKGLTDSLGQPLSEEEEEMIRKQEEEELKRILELSKTDK